MLYAVEIRTTSVQEVTVEAATPEEAGEKARALNVRPHMSSSTIEAKQLE